MFARCSARRCAATLAVANASSTVTTMSEAKAPRARRREDILEWSKANRAMIKDVANIRYNETPGFIYYSKSAGEWVASKFTRKKEEEKVETEDGTKEVTATNEKETAATAAKVEEKPDSGIAQYYRSQELRNAMKWKRLTWDDDADFDTFSNRLMENSHLFKKVPAFSYLSMHIIRDPMSNMGTVAADGDLSDYRKIEQGTLTKWALEEGTAVPLDLSSLPTPSRTYRPPAFKVNWETAEVAILDSASPYEVLIFLKTHAPQLQCLQQQYAEEQERLTEAVENVRVRCSLTAVKFNSFDRALRDDPEGGKPDYISPQDLALFCNSMLATAWLFRKHFKGHQVRVGPIGSGYSVDLEKREITIPADFGKYNYLSEHTRYRLHERIANSYRNYWYVWFFVATFIIGDMDLI